MTYVDNVLELSEDSCDRLANDGDSFKESSLADEDVQENLVDADKLFFLLVSVHCEEALYSLRGMRRRWRQIRHQP